MTDRPREVRLARGITVFVAVVVALNLAVLGVRAITRGEVVNGPTGSSFVTSGTGTAALFELYDRFGLDPERLTTGMTNNTLRSDAVLFVLEPGFTEVGETEIIALDNFVNEGGRLVMSGPFSAGILSELIDSLPEWDFGESSRKAIPVFPGVPSTEVASISGFTVGGWDDPGQFLPLFVDDAGIPVIIETRLGAGSVLWLSDVSHLNNANLGNLDNAELAIAIAQSRSPIFNEVIHGAGGESSLLPDQWRVAFWLGLGAVLVALVAYGFRMGPPEEVERRLDPERVGYVESVAGLVARTGNTRDAMRPIRTTARRLLAGRDPRAGDRIDNARLVSLATRHGLSSDEAELLINEGNEADPLEVAAAFATLQRRIKERL